MLPDIFYKERLEKLKESLKDLNQKKVVFGWARFFIITAVIGFIYFLLPYGLGYALIATALLLVGFIKIVFIDADNNKSINHINHLIKINEDELKALQHDYFHFADGSQFTTNDHLYANDFDILGRASLFQYINRATS